MLLFPPHFPVDETSTQHYRCLMLPELVDINGVWDALPPGIYDASMKEIELRFAINGIRRRLFGGLELGVQALRYAGCKAIFLDGSYVSGKTAPGDFDICWDPSGVDVSKLDPVLLDFKNKRRNQKLKFYGEFFPSSFNADGVSTYLEFFQKDRYSGRPKGIIRIRP